MTGTPEENAALTRRYLSDVVAGNDRAAADAFLTDDVVVHDLVFGGEVDCAASVFGSTVLTAADIDIDIEAVVATPDRVAVRTTVSGSHQASPAGRRFEIPCSGFCRVERGRIAEFWSMPDGLGLLDQLGLGPEHSLDPIRRTSDDGSHP